MEKRKYKVGIVTLSDKGSRGEREDLSGPKIQELLPDDRYEVVSYRILPDDQPAIEKELCRLADEEHCALVLTTGGTGIFHARCDTGSYACSSRQGRAGDCRGDSGIQPDDHTESNVKPRCQCNPQTDPDRQSSGKPEGCSGESYLHTEFTGTRAGYSSGRRWGMCTEVKIRMHRLKRSFEIRVTLVW